MLAFREISMEDKQAVEACASHYNYHLCEHCFVDLYMWRSHYNTQLCFLDGFVLIKMTPLDGGQDCYLAPDRRGRSRRCAGRTRAGRSRARHPADAGVGRRADD